MFRRFSLKTRLGTEEIAEALRNHLAPRKKSSLFDRFDTASPYYGRIAGDSFSIGMTRPMYFGGYSLYPLATGVVTGNDDLTTIRVLLRPHFLVILFFAAWFFLAARFFIEVVLPPPHLAGTVIPALFFLAMQVLVPVLLLKFTYYPKMHRRKSDIKAMLAPEIQPES